MSLKIVVAQFYTSNVAYGKHSEEINKKYCDEQGYIYHVEKDDSKIKTALEGRSATWYKPKFITEVFDLYEPDYVLFLDADAIVSDPSRRVEDFIEEGFNVVCTEDYGPSIMNAGVFLFKNSEWSKMILKKWWDVCEYLPGGPNSEPGFFKQGLWHDQTCFGYLIQSRLDSKNNIKIITNKVLNGRIYKHSVDNNFIFHAFSFGDQTYRTLDYIHSQIFNIVTDERATMSDIAKKYPTDKDFTHNYFNAVYEKYFSPIRDEVKKFCEIGVGGFWQDAGWVPGNSLKVWDEYFPNAEILGLDIKSFDLTSQGKVTVDYIDQSNKELVDEYTSKLTEYDIILDDGSHVMYDQQITMASFFKSLKSGGIFVMEDLHSSPEVRIPEKNSIWGWGDPTKITTLEMLESFKNTGKIISDYLSEEEKLYLEENIKSIEIFHLAPTSITSIIYKK
jgi:hypothetical protein